MQGRDDEKLESRFKTLAEHLSPDGPIRSHEYLRGRDEELNRTVEELRYSRTVPFIFGDRGVGKTSLARTTAQLVTASDREHLYIACAPGSRMLHLFRELCYDLLQVAVATGGVDNIKKKVEVNFSANPGIRLTLEKRDRCIEHFNDVNEAVRTLRDIDGLLDPEHPTVVVIDELEELENEDRSDLAYLVKQIGDQEFTLKAMLVGIAENVHELIGAHASIPRYIEEIALKPLAPQYLIDIVKSASEAVEVNIDQATLYRIAIIGNGYPHFAHLVGRYLLQECVRVDSSKVDEQSYSAGLKRAVAGNHEELRTTYEKATQRQDDIYKHLLWALADVETVDVRIDEWIEHYRRLSDRLSWSVVDDELARTRIQRLGQDPYGKIVTNPSIRYGDANTRYRYKRFSHTLMRSHVRLVAESEGARLGGSLKL